MRNVSINVPPTMDLPKRIERRNTGFVHPEELENINMIRAKYQKRIDEKGREADDSNDADAGARKVRITSLAEAKSASGGIRHMRRPTAFSPQRHFSNDEDSDSDSDKEAKQSVLLRLFENVEADEAVGSANAPTLKNYKPMSQIHPENILLTFSHNFRVAEESMKEKYIRHSMMTGDSNSYQVLDLQHGMKLARKISSDYVKTIDQIEHKLETSIRSVEYAKKRPAISVADNQLKNKKYLEERKNDQLKTKGDPLTSNVKLKGKKSNVVSNANN